MQNAKPMQFVVTSRSEIWATSHGNLYLECETDRGTVAFWGKTGNTRNIDSVESKVPPFSVSCEVIDGRWPQHRYWVMESKRLTFGRPMPAGSKVLRVPDFSAVRTKPGDVSTDELNQWRRRLLRLLDGIVKLRLTAAFGAQYGGFATDWSPVSWGSLDELFVNLTIPGGVHIRAARPRAREWPTESVRRCHPPCARPRP